MNGEQPLDQERVDFFAEQYAAMDDERLSTLLVTRGDGLTEEARHALDAEIARRDPAAFRTEVRAKVVDVEAQAAFERRRAQEEARIARQTRTGVWAFGALLVVAGASVAVLGKDGGGVFVSLGGGLIAWYEVRRGIFRGVRSMFRRGGASN